MKHRIMMRFVLRIIIRADLRGGAVGCLLITPEFGVLEEDRERNGHSITITTPKFKFVTTVLN